MLELDDRDRELLAEYSVSLNQEAGPRVGDFVTFANGVTQRISHRWPDNPEFPEIQTTGGGRFRLGNGFVSYSGPHHSAVRRNTLTLTEEQSEGAVWIFHHGVTGAGRDVHSTILFRVYTCSENAPA